ncbi:class I SAM-dependent methyltransferase [Pedobacter sp. GSP4]|uniref:class I SAM-dependent methyltransferase n=1 Tax=Pedobacter sp. GSP4 TaxID=3453716 RepID=UPI003EEF1712
MNLIDPAITDFYNQSCEDSRLKTGLGPLEFERNKMLITAYLGQMPLRIADIGGGTGHYSAWLSALGHKVYLVDPVPGHVQKAQKKAKGGSVFSCLLGQAGNLPFENSSFDLVILHGPLYHLQRQEDRLQAIRESRRILRPGGIVLGFAITRAASTLAALNTGLIHNPSIFQMCISALITGEHDAPEGMQGILSRAYYHRPNELKEEFACCGFNVDAIHAVEGMAWMDNSFFQSWADPLKKARLLELISLTELDSDLLSLSPHMMIAATLEL